MEWLAWILAIFVFWTIASVIALAFITAAGARTRCTCLGDYDDDLGRTCARCHE